MPTSKSEGTLCEEGAGARSARVACQSTPNVVPELASSSVGWKRLFLDEDEQVAVWFPLSPLARLTPQRLKSSNSLHADCGLCGFVGAFKELLVT